MIRIELPFERGMLSAMENANVVSACEKHIANPALAANCSGFVKAVAKEFGWPLQGQANDIFEFLEKDAHSVKFGVGIQSASGAAVQAATGTYLVIGASFNPNGHGHVVIVTGQDAAGNALVYGGSLGDAANASVNDRIQKRAWAKFKLSDPFVAAQPPSFYGLEIRVPFKG